MFYGTYVLASRGKVDGPKGEKWTVPIVDGPSKKDGPSKVDGLLTESGRSFDEKWTFLQKVDGPPESGQSF